MTSKPVRVNFVDELEKFCKVTGLSRATAMQFAWEEFKKSKKYSKIMLGMN